MPSSQSRAPSLASASQVLSRDRVGVWVIVAFVIAAASPLTVTAGLLVSAFAATGQIVMPVAFAAVALVLMLFVAGYVEMSRIIGVTGGLYAYVARGLGRPAGVGAAYTAVVAYGTLQVALYGVIGAAMEPVLDMVGVDMPWWMVALGALFVVGVLGVLRFEVARWVTTVLLVGEAGWLVWVTVMNFSHPAAGVTLAPVTVNADSLSAVGPLLAVGFLGFVGVEAAAVFSPQARKATTVKNAMLVAISIILVLYGTASWGMVVAVGPDRIVAAAQQDGVGLLFALAAAVSPVIAGIGVALFATSVLIAAISFQNFFVRTLYALGREGVIPRWFGVHNSRTGVPARASLVLSGIGFVVVFCVVMAAADPLVVLFYRAGTIAAVGVLLLMVLSAVAVGVFLLRHRTVAGGGFRAVRVASVLAALGLAVMYALALRYLPTMVGVPGHHRLVLWGRVVFPALMAVGVFAGLFLRAQRPLSYTQIGLGARAVIPQQRTPAHLPRTEASTR